MSSFEVKVRKIVVSAHPDPETTALEIGRVDDFAVVVGKGIYKTGDLVAYIPEASIVPPQVLKDMGLWNIELNKGRCAGPEGCRVKAIKLRGVVSQGICYPAKPDWVEGQDVAEELGVTKWIPPIPTCLSGEVGSCGNMINFDIENIKRYPDLFHVFEDVIVTEKLHGSCTLLCMPPEDMRQPDMFYDGRFQLISKGLAAQGLYFKDNEKNSTNAYVRVLRELNIFEKFDKACHAIHAMGLPQTAPIWMLGETFGNGIQDLKYGLDKPTFRAFGIKAGGHWLDYDDFLEFCAKLDIPTVPVLYRGHYQKELVDGWATGKTVEGKGSHIREGVVIAATKYRYAEPIGRPILKALNPDYLLRKGDATEFE